MKGSIRRQQSDTIGEGLKIVSKLLGDEMKVNARSIPRGMHPHSQYIVLRLLVCLTGMEKGDLEIANVLELAGTIVGLHHRQKVPGHHAEEGFAKGHRLNLDLAVDPSPSRVCWLSRV